MTDRIDWTTLGDVAHAICVEKIAQWKALGAALESMGVEFLHAEYAQIVISPASLPLVLAECGWTWKDGSSEFRGDKVYVFAGAPGEKGPHYITCPVSYVAMIRMKIERGER